MHLKIVGVQEFANLRYVGNVLKDAKAVPFTWHIHNVPECRAQRSMRRRATTTTLVDPVEFFKRMFGAPKNYIYLIVSHRIWSYLIVVIPFRCFMVVVLCHLWLDLGSPRPFPRVIWKQDPSTPIDPASFKRGAEQQEAQEKAQDEHEVRVCSWVLACAGRSSWQWSKHQIM